MKISRRFHTDLTPTSPHFHKFTSTRGRLVLTDKGGDFYDGFRFGMVLVACDRGGAGNLCPVQGQVYEVVEQAGAGKEKGAAREMGG